MAINLHEYPCKQLDAGDKYDFDCGNSDLNEFFHKDAILHKRELISVTYFFYDETEKTAISFFSIMNDAVRTDKFKDSLPKGKRYTFYPAVKIGRFGVNKKHQISGVGTQQMKFIKHLFTYENKTGCRFITVDAYNEPEILNFYMKSGFVFHTDKDKNKTTRTMRYDLKTYSDDLNARLQSAGRSTYSNR